MVRYRKNTRYPASPTDTQKKSHSETGFLQNTAEESSSLTVCSRAFQTLGVGLDSEGLRESSAAKPVSGQFFSGTCSSHVVEKRNEVVLQECTQAPYLHSICIPKMRSCDQFTVSCISLSQASHSQIGLVSHTRAS